MGCRGSATLRWKWNSAEGKEIYAGCVGLKIDGTPVSPTTSGPKTTTTASKPQTQPPSVCTKADVDVWSTGVEVACCPGLNRCLEDRSKSSPLYSQHPKIIMCRSQTCGSKPSNPKPTVPSTDVKTTVTSQITTSPSTDSKSTVSTKLRTHQAVSSCDKTRVNSKAFALFVCSALAFFLS